MQPKQKQINKNQDQNSKKIKPLATTRRIERNKQNKNNCKTRKAAMMTTNNNKINNNNNERQTQEIKTTSTMTTQKGNNNKAIEQPNKTKAASQQNEMAPMMNNWTNTKKHVQSTRLQPKQNRRPNYAKSLKFQGKEVLRLHSTKALRPKQKKKLTKL